MTDKQYNVNAYCVLSYIGILWIIGLLADKENENVKFHVNQGIILTIFSFSVYIVLSILSSVLYAIAPIFVIITSLFWIVYGITLIAFIAIGIMNVKKGNKTPLPIIGSMFNVLK